MFDFFGSIKQKPVSKSAFVQRRKLISPKFFQDFFRYTATVFYRRFPAKNWKGYQLLAVDGTGSRLPNEPWIGDALGWHENQYNQVPSARWLLTFDVLNKILLNVTLHSRRKAEITVQLPLVNQLPQNSITIYDRGFASYALPYLHQQNGTHCIIRLKTTFSPMVINFVQSTDRERIIQSPMTERAVRGLRKMGYKVSRKDFITYRLIRVDLPNNETEVLLTTLMNRKRFHHRHFKQLYNLRWGVETSIFILKSFFQAAVFASYTLPGVEQELWALFAMYNLQTMLHSEKEKSVQKINKKRQHNYHINRNLSVGLIKRFLSFILLDEVKNWMAKTKVLLDQIITHLEPIRPRPSRERSRKIMRGTERHIYESNYKPTL